MRKSRFTEQRIAGVLKRAEEGVSVKDARRELGVKPATFNEWRSQYGGLEAFDLKRLKEFEQENRRRKKMRADLSLDHEIPTDIAEKRR